MASVYRLLKPSDLKPSLVSRTVRGQVENGHDIAFQDEACSLVRWPVSNGPTYILAVQVFVLWPAEENEDGDVPSAQWYHARIDSCNVSRKTGTLFYDETEELEENADLADLIAQGHLAVSEFLQLFSHVYPPCSRALRRDMKHKTCPELGSATWMHKKVAVA